MCGIAGFSGHYEEGLLAAMNASVAHRGPDDADMLMLEGQAGRVGLAHRRLAIIDLSASAHEPMGVRCQRCGIDSKADPRRGRWIVYNGEIYNYRELRRELESDGHQFFSQSDTEVILHLYADVGAAMLPRLNGMFAFALYDGADGDLLVARDGFGVKPLYYAATPRGFLFASELKALLAAEDVGRELDLVALHEYIAYLWSPAPRTPFRDVRKLMPGEAMIVRAGAIQRRWTFYDLPYGQPPLSEPEEVIVDRVRETFRQAVRRQLVADVPVGAFLSGGLDSSSIVAMMREEQPDSPIACYTIAFEGGGSADPGAPNDLPFARQAAAHIGVDLRVVNVGPSMIDQLGRMLWHLDEPQSDPAPINAMLIADAARRDGVKVLMSGTGGDDIFSGYRRHVALMNEGKWRWLPPSARRRVARMARAVATGSGGAWMESPVPRRVVKALSYVDLPEDRRIASYFFWGVEELRRSLYAPAFAEALRGHDTASPLLASLARIPNERDPLNRMLYLEAKHFLADHNLNYTDKMTMSAAVESRVPFLDPDLVALAARIPSRLKQRGRTGKYILKRAMEPLLPQQLVYRRKTGFGAPLRQWLKNELRGPVDDLLASDAVRRRGLFEPNAVRRLISLDRAGRIDAAYTVFALLCIEMWCRLFVDR